MRSMLIIVGGLGLLGICIAGARLVSARIGTACLAFIVVWFGVAAVNLWLGVSTAGYSFAEELPIFLAIFGIPAAVALIVRRKF